MSAGGPPAVSPVVRVTTVVAVVVVALVAAVVSFSHMQEVAERAGERWRSWMVPLSVDGLIVAGSMVLLVRRRAGLAGGWLAWAALLGGVGASLACNVAAAEATTTARLIAAWPPLAFAGAFELLLQQRRAVAAHDDTARWGDLPEVPESVVSPVAPFRPGGFGVYPPVAPTPPTGRPGVVPASRPAFVPAVGLPSQGRVEEREVFRVESREGTARPAGRPEPAPQAGPVGKPAPKPRTDAQLTRAIRTLTERNGGTPPTAYAVKQALGCGNTRAARLLAELAATSTRGGGGPPPGHDQS